ncbi:hypothetical protein K458DRAFT_394682 [Lentithecium fluviatile CBS 122367]|uniref:Protein kinase domain-containing protein n=1 Tax=Lentithecium fluviatile CBS 122367 TaxID=1168545 RepID=A0A6G1IK75_9PLEO|nr:hypothetical protein K458DRAFT_394682 [Lentithecium fluviatile CBS 122367]
MNCKGKTGVDDKEDERTSGTEAKGEDIANIRATDDELSDYKENENGTRGKKKLPMIIPELFLWHAFGQLAEGFHFLLDEKDSEGDVEMKDGDYVELPPEKYLTVIVRDFDTAFFELKGLDDSLTDNPDWYVQRVDNSADRRGDYPPARDLYHEYYDKTTSHNFSSKTDVWGIGCIMYSLATNLLVSGDVPKFEYTGRVTGKGNKAEHVANGKPYSADDFKKVLKCTRGLEASTLYPDDLKDLIRECLRYN